jgi:hypothetical protein
VIKPPLSRFVGPLDPAAQQSLLRVEHDMEYIDADGAESLEDLGEISPVEDGLWRDQVLTGVPDQLIGPTDSPVRQTRCLVAAGR